MTLQELYSHVLELLDSPFEAGQLFTHVTGKQVYHLSFLGHKTAPDKAADLLETLCRRRKGGEPLQYLLGEWEFYGLPFKVGKGVLIPRPDTETLVEVALEKMADLPAPEILDLCSGSGCVAIALNHCIPGAAVTALELSDAAYAYLLENIGLNRSAVKPVRRDLMDYTHPAPLDLLVANPPYIPAGMIATLQTEVRHEPVRALDGGPDGLDFYRAIVGLYHPQLREGGWICLEVGIGQSRQVAKILAGCGFTDITVTDDLGGIPRVVAARRAIHK